MPEPPTTTFPPSVGRISSARPRGAPLAINHNVQRCGALPANKRLGGASNLMQSTVNTNFARTDAPQHDSAALTIDLAAAAQSAVALARVATAMHISEAAMHRAKSTPSTPAGRPAALNQITCGDAR